MTENKENLDVVLWLVLFVIGCGVLIVASMVLRYCYEILTGKRKL